MWREIILLFVGFSIHSIYTNSKNVEWKLSGFDQSTLFAIILLIALIFTVCILMPLERVAEFDRRERTYVPTSTGVEHLKRRGSF